MKSIKHHSASTIFCLAILSATATPALSGPIVVPTGLQPGATYRLAFVTSTKGTVLNTDLAYYNILLTNAANSVPELAALGTSWYMVGTTTLVGAKDNTRTDPFDPTHPNVPIYLLDGSSKITDNNASLWDGEIDRPINVNERGNALSGEFWTGSNQISGAATPCWSIGNNCLGSPALGRVRFGNTAETYQWSWRGAGYPSELRHYVAFSAVLVVPEPNPNAAPIANAGAGQSIRAGNTVNLNGGASYDDNTASTALGYAWSFVSVPAGSTASLASATTATPSFVADKAGTYVVGLVVTDEGGLASPQSQVVISSANQAPTANAGADQMVVVFSTVSLNGSGSTDPEGDALTYAWTIAGPTGSTAPLNGANTATPNFQPDVPGTYVMTLTASDFLGAGTPDTVEVTAITAAAYAELKIMGAANLIAGLGAAQVTTQGNQNALGNFLSQALKAVQRGDIATAISKINEAIERTNGCEVNPGPSPDGNGAGRDWVTDCGMQLPILAQLRSARDALTP